jgi:transcriptional regulator with XRE-family HTH domain
MDLHKIGIKIRVMRVSKGLNQENIANELNISITSYSKIERGKTNPSIMRLDQIARCLGVSVIDFLIDHDAQMEGSDNVSANPEIENILLKKEVQHLNSVIENKDEIIRLLKRDSV